MLNLASLRTFVAAALGSAATHGASLRDAYSPLPAQSNARLRQDIKAGSKKGTARARRAAAKCRNIMRNRRAHR